MVNVKTFNKGYFCALFLSVFSVLSLAYGDDEGVQPDSNPEVAQVPSGAEPQSAVESPVLAQDPSSSEFIPGVSPEPTVIESPTVDPSDAPEVEIEIDYPCEDGGYEEEGVEEEEPVEPIGMISYYGTKDDPYADSNTEAGIGIRDIPLRNGDVALSRPLENYVREQGGDVGSEILVTLADGTYVRGRFVDRVPSHCYVRGKKQALKTPRVDIYRPDLPSNNLPENDHADIIEVTPLNTD